MLRRVSFRHCLVVLALVGSLSGAGLAVAQRALRAAEGTPRPAQEACPNTDCLGTNLCEFLEGFQCYLTGGSCHVYQCGGSGGGGGERIRE